jgi:hypothetical protein
MPNGLWLRVWYPVIVSLPHLQKFSEVEETFKVRTMTPAHYNFDPYNQIGAANEVNRLTIV